jgi:hypothetical protein
METTLEKSILNSVSQLYRDIATDKFEVAIVENDIIGGVTDTFSITIPDYTRGEYYQDGDVIVYTVRFKGTDIRLAMFNVKDSYDAVGITHDDNKMFFIILNYLITNSHSIKNIEITSNPGHIH